MLAVAEIQGLPGIPSTGSGVRKWLTRHEVPVTMDGKRLTFDLSDLPGPVRAAFLEREAEHLGLEPGVFDPAAHERLEDATPRMRARAEQAARVARIAPAMGWDWPSPATIHNKWRELPASERWTLRHGAERALKMLRQPVNRDRGSLAPMELWSLDGQPKNLLSAFEDGTEGRAIELRLVGVGSGKIVGSRFCKTENSADTHALIMDAVRKHGAPLLIYTDNSKAFALHLVAGGAKFKFRKRAKDLPLGLEPPGICECLGVEVTFAKPGNGQAHETDHEFKTRMAAEGRAIYIPGKTDEQIKAERAQREKPRPLTLYLSEDQLAHLDTGLYDAVELIEDTGRVMEFLASGIVGGFVSEADMAPVLRMSARALKSAEREFAAIDLVAAELRTARACGAKGGKS